MYRLLSTCCAAVVSSAAQAQPTDLTVDMSQSSINLTVTLDTIVGSRTDSDSAAMTGSMRIELDSYESPTTITLHQYELNAGSLSFFFDYSFLGTISATAEGMSMSMPAGATPVTGTVMPDGTFLVTDVPNQTAGLISVTGTGAAGTALNDTMLDLSTLPQDPIEVSGIVNVDAGVVTIAISLPLDNSTMDPNTGTTVTLAGSATVIANGDVPEPVCLPDTNGDGAVTPADFSAWIAAFNAMAPACDQNGDGACTPADFSAWVGNYNAGCN